MSARGRRLEWYDVFRFGSGDRRRLRAFSRDDAETRAAASMGCSTAQVMAYRSDGATARAVSSARATVSVRAISLTIEGTGEEVIAAMEALSPEKS